MNLKRAFFSFLTFFSVIFFVSCGGDDNDLPKAGSYPKNVKVTYKVTGTVKKVDVLFTNESLGNTNLEEQTVPFTKQFNTTIKTAPTGIAFSLTSFESGSATLEILVDDKTVDTKTFSGTSAVIGTVSYVFQ